ncbi:hypothetical protein ACVWZM_004527 [Bradyrhizobium sp. USDA 4501]
MTKLSTVAAAAGSVMFFSLKRASALDEFAACAPSNAEAKITKQKAIYPQILH